MKKIKKIILLNIPYLYFLFHTLYKFCINQKKLRNIFKTNHKKNALLSYISQPFLKHSYEHTNYFEAIAWAEVLNTLNYNVDVINYENEYVDISKYDLICGFGNVFKNYFENTVSNKKITIYYGTGMHVFHQNQITLERLKNVYDLKGVWLGKSTRFVEKTWTHQTKLVDAIIALGNDFCNESYRNHYNGKIYSLNAPTYKIHDAVEIIENRSKDSKKNYLWFGSSGLIHKGLDLLLDFFSKTQDINLHICGPIYDEIDFCNVYNKELFESSNIYVHGFLNINGDHFKDILKECSFVIFPSCSEGGSPSVLNVIMNGGLIPIITKETTINTGNEIWINSFNEKGVEDAINISLALDIDKIKDMQYENYLYVNNFHTQTNYKESLLRILDEIIKNNS